MAEFQEVMKQAKRMCEQGDGRCVACPLQSVGNCAITSAPCFNHEEIYKKIEFVVMDWAEKNPESRYPSWKETWRQLFPNMTEKLPPCPRYFVEQERYRRLCTGSQCDACLDRPIPADIAEKLGIKPIGGEEDA
jgi:hypothetical protein